MKTAYELGWNSCNDGKLYIANPFASINQRDKYTEWQRGWKECQAIWDGQNEDFLHHIPKNK